MFKDNPDLYPTPEWLVKKMLSKEYKQIGTELAIDTKKVLRIEL